MSIFGPVQDYIDDKVSDFYHRVTGAPTEDEKRHQQKMMREQMQAYKDQTELTRQEIARKKNEELVEKRRVEEKQIRSLRRNYRAQSFLGGQATDQTDMSAKLGG